MSVLDRSLSRASLTAHLAALRAAVRDAVPPELDRSSPEFRPQERTNLFIALGLVGTVVTLGLVAGIVALLG